ncbi:MAG: nucleotide exchange factor GrpE [Chlamydiia bacterium]
MIDPDQPDIPFPEEEESVQQSELLTAGELSALHAKAAEAEEYREKYLRGLAEMENAKKRLSREKAEIVKYSNESLISDLLAPLDNLENALQYAEQGSAEVQHWALGFRMIVQQFTDALARAGAAPYSSLGQPFDPNLHDAVEVVEVSEDKPEGHVVKEFVKGYRVADRVIRPARVQVSKYQDNQT